jgi:hypothetical protein
MEAGSAPSEAPDAGYSGAAVAGAVLGTVFFPFISLIAALLLQGGQSEPHRRAQLRTWAWASGGWMLFQAVIFLVLQSVTL